MAMTSKLAFELVPNWEQLPPGYHHRDVCGVAVDSRDRVYVLTRDEARVIVYEPDGRFVTSWGEDIFTPRTHGITIGPNDEVYCVDDGNHTVRKFTTDGKLLLTLGTPGVASDTGYDGSHLDTILRGGPPFNRPTNLAVALSGELYVTDGYGNARVHRFAPDGTLIQSWGQPGTGPGQFNLPHGICVAADGRVLVADRENDRVQVFSPVGEFIEQWTSVQRPTQIYIDGNGLIYVSELWWRPGQRSYVHGVYKTSQPGRVSVFDSSGKVVLRWGASDQPWEPGVFCAPHGICVDSHGDVYVGEVTYTFGVKPGGVPEDCHTFQKFARRG